MSPSECFDSCARALSRLLDGFDVELSGDETEADLARKISHKARLLHPWEDSGNSILLDAFFDEDTIEDSEITWAMIHSQTKSREKVWTQPGYKKSRG